MDIGNQTIITEFVLLGFQHLHSFRILFFLVLLLIYISTLIANVMIITVMSISNQLISPMYFFLRHLSINDIVLSTNIIPNTLHITIANGSTMAVINCISQLYFFGASTVTECCLLTVMSYDRYLAICKPLHYTTVMDLSLCFHLVIFSWMTGFFTPLIVYCILSQHKFCGSHVIDHFFCELAPILDLSCTDTSIVEIITTASSIPLGVFQYGFIIVTYIFITNAILKISSNNGRQKAFGTCSSHLTVVCTYYGTLITTYIVPSKGKLRNINKVLSLLYTVFTPLCNPIIYSFRSQEIRNVLKHILHLNQLKRMSLIHLVNRKDVR